MSITWGKETCVLDGGKIIEFPERTEYSISELEEMERMDYESRHRGVTGLLFAALFSLPFWLLAIYIVVLRYYR